MSPELTQIPGPADAANKAGEPGARPPRSSGLERSNLLLLAIALTLSFGLFEWALRVVHPLTDPYWRLKTRPDQVSTYIPSQFEPNLVLDLETEQGLSGMSGRVRFTINNLGFRGDSLITPKPAGEFRIFVVGGSTTECLYLDDAQAFPRVLQDTLRALATGRNIRVYGAGKSGDKTYDHIAMVAHRIAHLKPDLIIVFAGINDLMASIHGRDFLFLPPRAEQTTWSMQQLLRFAATELQVGRLIFGALKPSSYRTAAEEIRLVSDIKGAVDSRRSLPVSAAAPPVNLEAYRENLRSLIGLARAQNSGITLITQATSWDSPVDERAQNWHWMNIGPGVSYAEAQMNAAMESYNDVVRDLGAELNVPVFDLAARLPKSLDYLYDDVHFNVAGAALAGGWTARFLQAQFGTRWAAAQ